MLLQKRRQQLLVLCSDSLCWREGAQACISGVVYGLGDLTAQTYEQRSLRDFDTARIARSALCGLLAHGPLSHVYYEKLDRFFILSPVRTNSLPVSPCLLVCGVQH